MVTTLVTNLVTIEPNDLHQGGPLNTPQSSASERRWTADPAVTNSFTSALQNALDNLPPNGGTIRVHPTSGTTPYPFDASVNTPFKDIRIVFDPGAKTTMTDATNTGIEVGGPLTVEGLNFEYDVTNIASNRCLFRLVNTTAHRARDFLLKDGFASMAMVNPDIQGFALVRAFGKAFNDRTPGLVIKDFVYEFRQFLTDDVTPTVQQTSEWVGTEYASLLYGVGLIYAENYRGVRVREVYVRGEIEALPACYAGPMYVFNDCIYVIKSDCIEDTINLSCSSEREGFSMVYTHSTSGEGSHITIGDNWSEAIAAKHYVTSDNPQWVLCQGNQLGRWSECESAFNFQGGGAYCGVLANVTHNMNGFSKSSDGSWDADPIAGQFKGNVGIESNINIGDLLYAESWSQAAINKPVYKVTGTSPGVIDVSPAPPLSVTNEPNGVAKLKVHHYLGSFDSVSGIHVADNGLPFRNSSGPVYKFSGSNKKMFQTSSDMIEAPD